MSKTLKLLLLVFIAIFIACILHSQYIGHFYLNKCMDEYPRDDLELTHNDIITLCHFPYVIKIKIEKQGLLKLSILNRRFTCLERGFLPMRTGFI